jgi:hypothetical protein
MGPSPPYLVRLQLKERAADDGEYPFSLPLIRCLDIEFTSPVTFFVGENGTGKSPSSRRSRLCANCRCRAAVGTNWRAITVPIRRARLRRLSGLHFGGGHQTHTFSAPSSRPTSRRYSMRAMPTRLSGCGAIRTHSMEDGRSMPARMEKPFWRFSRIGSDPGYSCSTSRSQRSLLNVNWRSWLRCPRWWQQANRSSSSRLIRQFC